MPSSLLKFRIHSFFFQTNDCVFGPRYGKTRFNLDFVKYASVNISVFSNGNSATCFSVLLISNVC